MTRPVNQASRAQARRRNESVNVSGVRTRTGEEDGTDSYHLIKEFGLESVRFGTHISTGVTSYMCIFCCMNSSYKDQSGSNAEGLKMFRAKAEGCLSFLVTTPVRSLLHSDKAKSSPALEYTPIFSLSFLKLLFFPLCSPGARNLHWSLHTGCPALTLNINMLDFDP